MLHDGLACHIVRLQFDFDADLFWVAKIVSGKKIVCWIYALEIKSQEIIMILALLYTKEDI